jgi:pyruvate formate lyase activating enzyme
MELAVYMKEPAVRVLGPGVRYALWVQGCPRRCPGCVAENAWDPDGGERIPVDALAVEIALSGAEGLTVSGGEPMLQMEFVTALFELAHQRGVHTVLDTAGQPYRADAADQRAFERLMDVTDLVMLDLKAMDAKLHRRVTGTGNANILAMARKLSDMGKPMWIRHVLVPGLTDSEDDLRQMAAFIGTLKTVERVEILPYHTLGLSKWKKLGIAYPLDGVPAPTADEVTRAEHILGIC